MKALIGVAAATIAFLPISAHAQDQDLRSYCPERPGFNTPACIIDKGHVSVETSIVDWTLDNNRDSRTDTVLIGPTSVRVGVTDTIEAQIGWTPYGHVRERDKATGLVDTRGRVGDVTLGVKANLQNPDGSGFAIAALPFVSLPVGRTPVGSGDWGAGFVLPTSYQLTSSVSLAATPQVDAAVDSDGNGRHLAYGSAAGVSFGIAQNVTLTPELSIMRDEDPSGSTTQSSTALSLAWLANDSTQFDIFGAAGLNRDSPDVELYAGISHRF